jgi:hypothetical protein
MTIKTIVATAIWMLGSSAFAQTTCAMNGPPPDHVDPTVAPKIVAWVTSVESKFGLTADRWHGMPAEAPTREQASLLELQALVSNWASASAPGTVEGIFRAAVQHGVNVQYESLMAKEDPGHADVHRTWANTEAARASACLALIRQP